MYVVETRVYTAINAPSLPKTTVMRLVTLYELHRKYTLGNTVDKELIHIDAVFLRAIDPADGRRKPYIRGSTVFGAIKTALGYANTTLEYPTIYGMFFEECDVVLDSRRVTTRQGRPTVYVTEIVLPGAKGKLIIAELPNESLRPEFVQVGGWRKKGFGLVRIVWEKTKKIV